MASRAALYPTAPVVTKPPARTRISQARRRNFSMNGRIGDRYMRGWLRSRESARNSIIGDSDHFLSFLKFQAAAMRPGACPQASFHSSIRDLSGKEAKPGAVSTQ